MRLGGTFADTFEEDELELISYFEATWIGWTEAATNSCKISYSKCNVERRGKPLYWINSYNKRPGGVSSLFQLVGCLSTSIDMSTPEVPPKAAGFN